MFDNRKDRELAALWESGVATGSLDAETIAELAQKGMTYCEGYCLSKKYTGADRCACIREIFPSPKDYKLYLAARNRYEKLLQLGLLAKALSKDKNRDTNDNH
jgi:hypothetical protein